MSWLTGRTPTPRWLLIAGGLNILANFGLFLQAAT